MSRMGGQQAGLLVLVLAAAAALALVVYSQNGNGRGATELLWEPHPGPLTQMIKAAKVEKSELHAKAKKQMLATRPQRMSRTTALSWAKRQLEHGSSMAEGQDRPQSAYSRNYGGGIRGYTSDTRETIGSASAEAQQFANLISNQANEREDKQVGGARETELADASDSALFGGHQQTAMARETRAGSDTKSWSWASGLRKSSALAAQSKMPSGMHAGPLTTAVREDRSSPEQKAWQWAAAHFDSDAHRDRVTMPKVEQAPAKPAVHKPVVQTPAAPQTVAQPVAVKQAVHQPHAVQQKHVEHKAAPEQQREVQQSNFKDSSPRAAKLMEAHKALEGLHKATLTYEHNRFAKKAAEESFRANEIASREASSERAADEGADAEFDEYGQVASLGIPSGARSATTTENMPYAFREEARYRPSRAEAMDREVANRGRRSRNRSAVSHGTAQDIAHQVEQAYRKGFNAGIRSEEKAIDDAESRQMRATAEKRMKARQAQKAAKTNVKAVAAKDAREQSLADNTWDDADADFQVDGDNWGPGSGDWA